MPHILVEQEIEMGYIAIYSVSLISISIKYAEKQINGKLKICYIKQMHYKAYYKCT